MTFEQILELIYVTVCVHLNENDPTPPKTQQSSSITIYVTLP